MSISNEQLVNLSDEDVNMGEMTDGEENVGVEGVQGAFATKFMEFKRPIVEKENF